MNYPNILALNLTKNPEIGRFSVRIDEKLELVLKKAVFLYGLVRVSQRELSRSHAPKNEISTAKSDANSLIINLCGERGSGIILL